MNEKSIFLDEMIKDFKAKDIINIIGKVGNGKTSLVVNIVRNIVINSNKNVAIFSLETTSVSLLSLITEMKNKRLNVFINKTDFEKDKEIDEETSKGFFYIYDGESVKTGKIKSQIDNLIEELKKRKQKLDLVCIDYLQLTYPSIDSLYIDTEDKKGKILKENYDVLIKQFANINLNEVMETNIKKLKEISENYNIPIILVTMLSNNDEKRDEQRKIIKDNSDIVLEIKKQEDISQIEITNSKSKTEIINCKFDKKLCEFIQKKEDNNE